MSTEFVLLSVIFGFGVGILVSLFRMRALREITRLERYEHWANRFFDKVRPLAEDADTPESIIDVLRALNTLITERTAARGLCRALSRRSHHDAQSSQAIEDLKQRPELLEAYAEALYAGLMAISYADRKWGVFARALLADAIEGKQRFVVNVSSDVKEVTRKVLSHRDCGDLMPA